MKTGKQVILEYCDYVLGNANSEEIGRCRDIRDALTQDEYYEYLEDNCPRTILKDFICECDAHELPIIASDDLVTAQCKKCWDKALHTEITDCKHKSPLEFIAEVTAKVTYQGELPKKTRQTETVDELLEDIQLHRKSTYERWETYHNLLCGLSITDGGFLIYKALEMELQEILDELDELINKYN